MTQLNIRIFLVLLTAIIVAGYFIANPSGALSLREFLGLEISQFENNPGQTKDTSTEQTQVAVKSSENDDFPGKLDFNEIQKIVSVVDENQRKVLLADETAFRNFIRNEAMNKSVLTAAYANGIKQNERNKFIAQRGSENIFREIYLKQLIPSKIPADFPTEEQLREYYEQNKSKYVLEERLQIWQVFLPVPDDMDKKEIELIKKQANAIKSELEKNKTDFNDAVLKYSHPAAGKYQGGYMGLVKVSDLKPELSKPVLSLEPGKISEPLKSDTGIHIVKRGEILPRQQLRFEEVREQIRKLLVTQAQNELRQAVYKKAAEIYPVDLKDETIEEWRLKLRTNTGAGEVTSDS